MMSAAQRGAAADARQLAAIEAWWHSGVGGSAAALVVSADCRSRAPLRWAAANPVEANVMTHSASRTRQIANSDLRVGDVPSRDAPWGDIQVFALSFNAYEHWGSFERCAEIANRRQHGSLTELRTCLFFEQRRWRHFGDKPESDALSEIGDLLDTIRDKVHRGELT